MIRPIYILPLVLSLTASCVHKSDNAIVLDTFRQVESIAPSDSISLDPFGIYMPQDVIPYKGWYVIRKYGNDNWIDIINTETGEKIECFRRGRGPGEILNISPLQLYNDLLYVFDVNSQTYYALDMENTIKEKRQVLSDSWSLRSGDEAEDYFDKPFFLTRFSGGILATGMFRDGSWYGLLDKNGKIKSGIPLIEFKSTKNLTDTELSAFQLSSLISVKPDGSQGICAQVFCGAFSIFDIEGEKLNEKIRIIYYDPKFHPSDGTMISPRHDRENVEAFYGAKSTDDYIFLLYSGKAIADRSDPTYECRNLLVYDWNGNPVKRYELKNSISSIFISGDTVYGVTSVPNGAIYAYSLN